VRICWLAALFVSTFVTAWATVTATKDANQPEFGSISWIDHALQGKIYFLPNTTQRLPDFNKLRPVGAIYATTLNVPTTNWTKGFPGITDRFEWFGIVYTGTIHALQAGRYKLRVASDDGSKIYVDDKLIINNDGLHSIRSVAGNVDLDTARHKLRIEYMQGPRYWVALQVYCTAPGGKEKLFPACNLAIDSTGCRFWWLWLLLMLLLVLMTAEIWRRRRKRLRTSAQTSPPTAAGNMTA
jgi:hypothetical protein